MKTTNPLEATVSGSTSVNELPTLRALYKLIREAIRADFNGAYQDATPRTLTLSKRYRYVTSPKRKVGENPTFHTVVARYSSSVNPKVTPWT